MELVSEQRDGGSPADLTILSTMTDRHSDKTPLLHGLENRLFELKERTDRAIQGTESQIDKLTQLVKRQDRLIQYLTSGNTSPDSSFLCPTSEISDEKAKASASAPECEVSKEKHETSPSPISLVSSASTGSSRSSIKSHSRSSSRDSSASRDDTTSSDESTSSSHTSSSDERTSSNKTTASERSNSSDDTTTSGESTSSDGSPLHDGSFAESSVNYSSSSSTTSGTSLISVNTDSHKSSTMSQSTTTISGDCSLRCIESANIVDLKVTDEVSTMPTASLPFVTLETGMPTSLDQGRDDCHDEPIWRTISPSQCVDQSQDFARPLHTEDCSSTGEVVDDSRQEDNTVTSGSRHTPSELTNNSDSSWSSSSQLIPSWDSSSSKKDQIRHQTHMRESKVRNLLSMLHTKLKKRSSKSREEKRELVAHDEELSG